MGDSRVTIYPADPFYRPTPAKLDELVAYLTDVGVGEKEAHGWLPGDNIGDLLVTEWHEVREIAMKVEDEPGLMTGDGGGMAWCRGCGSQVDVEAWMELAEQFFGAQEDPVYICPECQTRTTFVTMDYDRAVAIGCFMVNAVDLVLKEQEGRSSPRPPCFGGWKRSSAWNCRLLGTTCRRNGAVPQDGRSLTAPFLLTTARVLRLPRCARQLPRLVGALGQ